MKKKFAIVSIILLSLCFMSMAHKFYVAIFQVNYAPDKKMLQVTTRIFADDLDDALQKKHGRKFHFAETVQPPDELPAMQKYMAEKFHIAINGKPQQLTYLSNELENNVLICYFRVTGVEKIQSIKITSRVLFDLVTEQQNIIQTNINGKKSSLLLTLDNPDGTINY